MVIVIVRWYIKKEKESEKKFKTTWIGMEPKSKDGLFREFFSRPTDEVDAKYHSLDFENIHYSTYINVGVWRELSDFNEAIGQMIPGRKRMRINLMKKLFPYLTSNLNYEKEL